MVNHMAAKTIENVCSRESQYAQGFITAEVGPALWYLFTHSTVDALRVSAISVSIKKHNSHHFNREFKRVLFNSSYCLIYFQILIYFTFRELVTKVSQCI